MMIDIRGKKILLMVPYFFEYHNMIRKELEEQGGIVTLIENKLQKLDPLAVKSKILLVRKISYLFNDKKKAYFNNQIKPIITNQKFDYVIAINGFSISAELVNYVKQHNPKVKTILYLWDTLEIFDWRKLFKYFDKILTFDKNDSINESIGYLPNFYPKKIATINKPIFKNDLYFVGTQHHDRFKFLDKIYNRYHSTFKLFIILLVKYKAAFHSSILYSTFKLIKSNSFFIKDYIEQYELFEGLVQSPFLIYKNISYEEINRAFEESKAILDVDLPYQSGYSHRVMLALSAGKKLLTTNKWIVNEDFYSDELIQIIDRENPIVDFDWINREDKPDISAIMLKYRIDNWIKTILE